MGVRPAHNGTQIAKSAIVSSGSAIVHTVTSGKIFYLTTLIFDISHAAFAGYIHVLVRDISDVVVYYLVQRYCTPIAQVEFSATFNPPLEIPSGYDIVVEFV